MLPGWLSSTESVCQSRRHRRCGLDPWVRKIPGEGNGNPLQYSCLEDPMHRAADGQQFMGFLRVGCNQATEYQRVAVKLLMCRLQHLYTKAFQRGTQT